MEKYKDAHHSPFGIKQVPDLLVVDLHVGDLHLERVAFVLLTVDSLKEGAAEPRD